MRIGAFYYNRRRGKWNSEIEVKMFRKMQDKLLRDVGVKSGEIEGWYKKHSECELKRGED